MTMESLRPQEPRTSVSLSYEENGQQRSVEAIVGQTLAIFGRNSSADNLWTIEEIMDEPIVYEGTGKEVHGFWLSRIPRAGRPFTDEEEYWYGKTKDIIGKDGLKKRLYQVSEDTLIPAIVSGQTFAA